MNQVIRDLKNGKKGIAIWGLGYIGYSSMAYFARAGVKCLGYDLIETRVKQIKETGKIEQKGKTSIPNLNFWLGFDVEHMFNDGLINATHNWEELISNDYPVHLIAVPTEKVTEDGGHKPFHGYLKDVFQKLITFKDVKTDYAPLIIVESTLSQNVLDEDIIPLIENNGLKIGEDLLLGVAPRRDWFVDPDKTLKTIPRVVGGTTKETTELMKEVLELISNTILKADDHKHAAIVKSIENAYRQVEITLANQLSVAYPDLNMRDILKLVGTKWNIGTYYPGFGIGGYCLDGNEWVVVKHQEKIEFIRIKNVKNKYDILSYDNLEKKTQFRKVENVAKRKSETLTFNLTGNHRITVTPDHIMYIKKNRLHKVLAENIKIGDELPFINHLSNEFGLWKAYPYLTYSAKRKPFGVHINIKRFAEEKNLKIKIGHQQGKIVKTGKGKSHQKIPYSIFINGDIAELMGLYISEGCVTLDRSGNAASLRTYITLHQDEKETANFVKKTLEKTGIQYIEYEDKKTKAYQIRVSGNIWGNLIREFAGSNSYDAKIHPFLLFNPKKGIREGLFKGIINGDGYFDKKTGVIEYYTSSPVLSQQVLFLSRSLGLIPVLRPDHNNSKLPLIRFSGDVARIMGLKLFRDDKLKNVKKYIENSKNKNQKMRRTDNRKIIVKGIIKNKKQIVYGIDVAKNHNFITTGGLLVHNCIPLAPHYVLEGAKNPEALTLLKHSIEFDEKHPERVANSLRKRGIKNVGILGIAYAPDLKVHVLSPALTIVRKLKEHGIDVKVSDPYYTDEELTEITKAETFKFPDELDKFDAVLIAAGHMKYRHTNHDIIKSKLENCKLILDNNGIWKDIDFNPVEYHVAGDKNWLEED